MRVLYAGITASLLMLPLGAPASAAVETVTGQLVDKACYQRNPKNTGERHVRKPIDECASTCARLGLPVAVLTADGKLYQVTGELAKNRNARLISHVTRMVTVTGDVTTDEEGGLLIAATDIKASGK